MLERYVTQSQLDRFEERMKSKMDELKKQMESLNKEVDLPKEYQAKLQNMLEFFKDQAGVAENNKKILQRMADFFAGLSEDLR